MALNNGIRNIIYNTVRKGDVFEWVVRSGKFTCSHEPILWEDQKEILGFYCTWEDEHGNLFGVAMPKSEVDGIMDRSKSKDKDGNTTGPWKNDYEQMALKTVVKRAAKQWPLPYAVQQAMQTADDLEFGGMRNVTPPKPEKKRIRLESEEEAPSAENVLPEPKPQPDTLFDLPGEKQPVAPYMEDH